MNILKSNTEVLRSVNKAKYIRVSSMEQSMDRQRENVSDICLYEDTISGLIPFSERPAGSKLIKDIKEGKIDYVIIHSIDRLGRNVVEMQKQLNWFIEKKVQIFAENIRMELLNEDGSMNSIAKMIIDLLGSVAGLEIEAIKERQQQGINIAKAKGVYKGRKIGALMSDSKYFKRHKDVISLLKDGLSINKVSKLTGKAFVTVRAVNHRISLS
jgi:DNA invertase Pin-like site-specific DNA recombinase